jgi:hypothetical protein
MLKKNLVDVAMERFDESLPEIISGASTITGELVQTTVWLVGLASAVLAVIVTKDTVLVATPILRNALGITLFATVLLGVLQRICQQRVLAKEHYVMMHVRQTLRNARPWDAQDPTTPGEHHTAKRIVELMNTEFGIDYTFALSRRDALERLREAHQWRYDLWKKGNEGKVQTLVGIGLAVRGKPQGATLQAEDTLEEIRTLVRSEKRWGRASTVLYIGTGLSFVASILVMMLAILGRG